MKPLIVRLFAVVVLFAGCASAEITGYRGSVQLDPAAGKLKADLTMTVVGREKAVTQEVLYLNKGLHIDKFECAMCSGFSLDITKTNQMQFVPQGVPLTIQFKQAPGAGETATIRVQYSGGVVPDPYGVNLLTTDWIELGMYSGWYPYSANSMAFTFDLGVQIDPAYKVSCNGEVRGKAGEWRVVEDEFTSDMVVVAARDLKTTTVQRGGMQLRVDSAGVPDAAVEKFVNDTADMVGQYTRWYGASGLTRATFILNRRVSGGGYVRQRFMSLPYSKDQLKWLAHEVGHFWWMGAPVTGWEDWLNESFAEYSSLRYVRETRAKAEFEALIETARQRSMGKAPVWGIARNDPNAHDVLYDEGALRLLALEQMIGTEKFTTFVATLHRDHIKSTDALLKTLEQQTSSAVRQRFEATLKSAGGQ